MNWKIVLSQTNCKWIVLIQLVLLLSKKGAWNNSEIIPESLSFTLKLKDGNNFECTFTNETQTDITCAIKNVKFKVEYTDTYMDANNEYLLEGLTYDKDYVCLSSYIYSNLILLFIIIFILFI